MSIPAIYSHLWREQYAQDRYLRHLAPDDLAQRHKDLLNNVLDFRCQGPPQFTGFDEDTGWTRRIADVVAEVDLRQVPRGWLDAVEQEVRKRPYPRVFRALEAWGSRNYEPGDYIVKYGRRDDMDSLVERGLARVNPASSYADPSLNPAIRDKELEFSTHFPPGTRLQVELGQASGVFQDIPGIEGPLTHTRECEDFYVFCTSAVFDPRLFDDFSPNYDACVLVHDWRRFIDAIKSCPAPARKISAGPTVYLDPYRPHRKAEVPFLKHLRYAYQREWRIVWTMPLNPPPLAPFRLELGDLRSYCELIGL